MDLLLESQFTEAAGGIYWCSVGAFEEMDQCKWMFLSIIATQVQEKVEINENIQAYPRIQQS